MLKKKPEKTLCGKSRAGCALLLAAALFAGCGGTAEIPAAAGESTAPAPEPERTLPVVDVSPAGSAGEAQSGLAAETAETDALAGAAGLWALTEVEVEGDRMSAEMAGLSVELFIREDGTADYVEISPAGETSEYLNLIVDGDGDGRLDFGYDTGDVHWDCVVVSVDGDALELSCEWRYPDGTPGGSTMFFRRWELDERGRMLYPAELEKLTASLDSAENGFFLCTYDRPEEIDWTEVCYNGAGIALDYDPELWAAYENRYGPLETSLTAIRPDALEDFVWNKTQTPYAAARRPITYNFQWDYLSDCDAWCFPHGDTNYQPIEFTGGYASGYEYYLYYTRSDWENYIEERPFVMHCYIRDGEGQYLSNLPADVPAPVTLLDIEFFETREEAVLRRGVTEFVENEPREDDEPYGWCWAVITARTDGVRCIVDRLEHSEMFGVTLPGDNLTACVLDEGECFAVYVNQPWHPAVSVTATKDEYWGEYIFGEDNWLHLDNTPRYVTGRDLQGEGRGCYPESEEQLVNFLMDGSWLYLDETTGEVLATLWFDEYRNLTVRLPDESYPIYVRYGYADADRQSGAPDLLMLERDDYAYEFPPDWSAVLPDWYTFADFGDYLVSAVQLDCEQVLYLTQANNGDAALGYLLTGDGDTHTIELHRWRGTAVFEPQG